MEPSMHSDDLSGFEEKMASERCIIGVAGPMAAGKNLVSDILSQKGFEVLDGDKLGHEVLESEKEKIITLFANEVRKHNISLISEDGSINRRNLALIVFANKKNLLAYEAIIHPKINQLIEQKLDSSPKTSYVINAAMLHKISVIKRCSCVLFIDAPFILRFKRVRKRNKMPLRQILQRFYVQLQIFDKCKKLNADIYRVDNSGTQEHLEQKIEKALNSCLEKG